MNDKQQILKALDMLVGTWNSSGTIFSSEGNLPIEVKGTDAYEWLRDEQFMVHRADVMVGDSKVDVIEIIGAYDKAKKACAMYAFQSDGSQGVMWASVNKDGSLLFAGDDTRATLTIHISTQTMDAKWERREYDQWVHWMDMHFAK